MEQERIRQDNKFGDQSGNNPFQWVSILGEEHGELCEAINETYFFNGLHPDRAGIDKIVKEATHVAAVAVAIIEANLEALKAQQQIITDNPCEFCEHDKYSPVEECFDCPKFDAAYIYHTQGK